MVEGAEILCDCLRLTKLENEQVCLKTNLLEEVVNRGRNCLLVKLLSHRGTVVIFAD